MRIEILNGDLVINEINASEEFAEHHYPGAWRVSEYQDTPSAPTAAEIAMQTIERLEREQLMPRINREFILGAMKKEAEEAGYTEQQLEAKNKGYRLLKQFDAQIAALRAQL